MWRIKIEHYGHQCAQTENIRLVSNHDNRLDPSETFTLGLRCHKLISGLDG